MWVVYIFCLLWLMLLCAFLCISSGERVCTISAGYILRNGIDVSISMHMFRISKY